MINQIKKKFILTAMIAVTILLAIIVIGTTIANTYFVVQQINENMEILVETRGNLITVANEDSDREVSGFFASTNAIDVFLSSNFFVVKFDRFGNIEYIDASRNQSIDTEEAATLAAEYFTSEGDGFTGRYVYSYTNSGFTNETYAIFLDITSDIANIIRVFVLSLAVACLGWIIMLVVVMLLSKRMIRPIASNIEKQKEFITNAGHELKTPLAIIQANTEAIEIFSGSNKYSINIKKQIDRLSGLMNNMLVMSRMEETINKENITEFDLSAILDTSIDNFEESFALRGITITREIPDELKFKGDMTSIANLLEIFVDNAQKYTSENGNFSIKAYKTSRKVHIEFSNDTEEVEEKDLDHLFDRFYRSDKSHNQKGGYGIGLALASEIIEAHNGEISTKFKDGRITFSITLVSQ